MVRALTSVTLVGLMRGIESTVGDSEEFDAVQHVVPTDVTSHVRRSGDVSGRARLSGPTHAQA